MTREEAIEVIKAYRDKLTNSASNQLDGDIKAFEMAIQALSQEPCDDAISKQNIIDTYKSCADMLSDEELKGADLVMEWVNNAPTVTQKPIECDDAISRDAALEKMADYVASGYAESAEDFLGYSRIICQLPSVTPSRRKGHWKHFAQSDDCSECGWSTGKYISPSRYCPNCGAKMVEPQESKKVNCKSTKCENCINHNYCDYEPQESEE